MEDVKKDMCNYCGKWFPESELRIIPEDDPRFKYCDKHYEEVRTAILKFPWNKGKYY